MHIVVMFINVGSYHAARLRAADVACRSSGRRLTAVQVTDQPLEHPWGDLSREITFPLETLVSTGSDSTKPSRKHGIAIPGLRVESVLDRLAPDAVALPGWGFPVARAALEWCRRHSVAAVLMSESSQNDKRRHVFMEFMKSWLYVRRFGAALVGGRSHRDYVVSLGLPPERVFLGYDAVDNEYFAREAAIARRNSVTLRSRNPDIPADPFFLSVTRFLRRKNVPTLIHGYSTYRHVVGDKEAWKLVICGSGDRECEIRAAIHQQGLDDFICLPGFVSYHDLGPWYGLAEALVHPALGEQWGLVVNEACAAGLPIVCSRRVGACHELVRDGWNGLIFEPTDTKDLGRVLVAIHRLDPALRRMMGQNSQRLVAEFGPERFANGLLAAVDAAAAGRSH